MSRKDTTHRQALLFLCLEPEFFNIGNIGVCFVGPFVRSDKDHTYIYIIYIYMPEEAEHQRQAWQGLCLRDQPLPCWHLRGLDSKREVVLSIVQEPLQ